MKTVILMGYPCSGKSSAGKKASEMLSIPFIDTDCEIGNCVSIVKTFGLAYFRELESRVIASLSSSPASIIAIGGGAILSEANQQHLKRVGLLVYLAAPSSILTERNIARIPFPTYLDPDDPHGSWQRFYASREKIYPMYAQATLDTMGLSIDEVAENLTRIVHGQ